jgi:patatin-related protein
MTDDGGPIGAGTKPTTELRLALVCYGGVSLAVYMHGVTKELHKLICAARAFDKNPENNPFPGRTTEAVYFEALRGISATGPKLSVSIDIIGGTSAGGINGIALSKALACNVDMEPLKDVWLNKGDIRQLLRGYSRVPLALQVGLTVVWQLVHALGNSSPLKGEYMSKLLYSALKDMQGRDRLSDAGSLLPGIAAGLELYVPTTDLLGFDVLVASGAGGASNRDHDFRQVMVFSRNEEARDKLEQFGDQYTADLAFAGRASSSFPGAFAPVSPESFIDEVKKIDPHTADADVRIHPKTLFLRPYGSRDIATQLDQGAAAEEAWAEAKDVYFVDGGVLDNAPFDLVIDAIARRQAQRQVYRQLVYVEPDPGQALYAPISGTRDKGKSKRRWLKDLLAVSGARSSHPILTDLTRLRDLNWRIAEVRAISEQQEKHVAEETRSALNEVWERKGGHAARDGLHVQTTTELVQELTDPDIQAASDKLYERAQESLKPIWPTYLLLRLEAVLKELSTDICWTLQCPKPSNKGGFITAAWVEWARAQDWGDWTPLRARLDATDMLYRQRRLLFIINGINAMYDTKCAPPRPDLDTLKGVAWSMVDEIRSGTATAVGALKGEGALDFLNISDTDAVKIDPKQFADDYDPDFRVLFDKYQQKVEPLTLDSDKLRDAFAEHTRDPNWTEEAKTALLSGYLGFPLWDGMLFPTISLSDIPQFSPIPVARFSPTNATALKPPVEGKGGKLRAPLENEQPPVKLKGIPVKHFAAFFATRSRQNDYLWGRLDGAELILRMLADVGLRQQQTTTLATVGGDETPAPPYAAEAFGAVLASESDLDLVKDLCDYLRGEVAKISRTPVAPSPSDEAS